MGPDGHKVDYFVPNFGVDKEMISDANNLAEAEKNLGAWDYKPAAVAWKLNYAVPNFGIDHDIGDSLESEKQTSAQLDHKWEPRPTTTEFGSCHNHLTTDPIHTKNER